MTVFTPSHNLAVAHARRIDKLVCQMHADRLRVLALEADAGFPARSVSPVRVVIRARRDTLLERAFGWLDGVRIPVRVPAVFGSVL